MKKLLWLIVISTCFSFSVNARIFKCSINGKTTYQDAPCPDTVTNEMDLTVNRPSNKQIYEAQERMDSWNKEKTYKLEAKRERERIRQDNLYYLEVQKANAATRQADATHDDSVAHRKEAEIELRNLELQSGKIRTLSERDKLRKKWGDRINSIK